MATTGNESPGRRCGVPSTASLRWILLRGGRDLRGASAAFAFAISNREGAQPEFWLHADRGLFPVGEHDRAALAIENADRVVQDRIEKLVFAFEVNQVVPGP